MAGPVSRDTAYELFCQTCYAEYAWGMLSVHVGMSPLHGHSLQSVGLGVDVGTAHLA